MLEILADSFLLHVCPLFLYMQEMFALNQSCGSSPVSIECWYIVMNIDASSSAHSLRTLFGILSGPDAFERFTFLSRSVTPFSLIVSVGVEFLTCFVVFGILTNVSLVKTDWNCLINISAFSLLLVTS
jgi:hypothetical protein